MNKPDEQIASGSGEMTIEATIIRANGKTEKLGQIYSSNKLKNFFIQLRMKIKQQWQQF